MTIERVAQNTISKALGLLRQNNLPIEDISADTALFAILKNEVVIGTVGVEFYEDTALLRSLAVREEFRSNGVAKKLLRYTENFAKENGAKEIFLLTTTAPSYFLKESYQPIERKNVSEKIKQSREFISTCPSSAIIMKKIL